MKPLILGTVFFVVVTLGLPSASLGQSESKGQDESNSAEAPTASVGVIMADYPKTGSGLLIQSQSWIPVTSETPVKTKAGRGWAASLSYGAVPATLISEYEGAHAAVEVAPGRPVVCICHVLSLPGTPAIVKLHSKKASRVLDGGRMTVYPIVGGSKMMDANKSDLIQVEVSHPESTVWVVRPQQSLTAGEYAIMLGTQNVMIYPFTIGGDSAPAVESKH